MREEEPSCPCLDPDRRGHYHPDCPDYCNRCNYNNHTCHTCGDDAPHDEELCLTCQQGGQQGDFVRIGTSWVDPSRVVAVEESDISRIRIHLDTGANLPTGIPSSPEAIRLILDAFSNAR